MIRAWRLDDARQTLVIAAHEHHLPQVVYWGPRLPEQSNLTDLYHAHALDITGGMLDTSPALSLCPEAVRSFPGHPGLILRDQDATPLLPAFSYVDAIEDAIENVSESSSLTLYYEDNAHGLRLAFDFTLDPQTHVITASTQLDASLPVHLDWLAAPVMPAPQHADRMIDFAGRWCGEFQTIETPWSAGMRYRENRTGRTGHAHFPSLIVPTRSTTNTQGEAYAFHYGWSGGHKMVCEELPDGRRQIQFGHASHTENGALQTFSTAPLYMTYSAAGINGCATAFQRHVRDRIVTWPDASKQRPVHFNCWEAVYFDHNVPELQAIATRAAELGAERFVLDDGWFNMRDNDTRALADWVVDTRKYPDGLTPLIDHVHQIGMSFGLWFEPEMINENSDTYRAHPDWALGPNDQILGRQQKALNMALPDVQDFLYERIATLLRTYAIDYIKWDHNRVLPSPDATQTRGTYALLDRLRQDFPQVEIESCASGGGRIDFGILARAQRVWLSDSNDALERLRIQHNAALFLPSVVTGSHTGPRTSHTSGRTIDIRMRAWVAAQRHMGFEMDPRELTAEEAAVLSNVTKWWKANRDWLARADILRLDSDDPSVIAELQLAESKDRFVVFAGKADTSTQISPRPLRLTGLEPHANYQVHLTNRDEVNHLSRGHPILKTQDVILSGAYLMGHGLTLPWSFPLQMWVIEGTKL